MHLKILEVYTLTVHSIVQITDCLKTKLGVVSYPLDFSVYSEA